MGVRHPVHQGGTKSARSKPQALRFSWSTASRTADWRVSLTAGIAGRR